MQKRIAVLVGSLRRESFNRKMANNLIKLAPSSLLLKIVEIGSLPLYNQDLDETPPQPELYIGGAGKIFNDKGDISVDSTRELVSKFIHVYADWVMRLSAVTK